MAKEEEGAKPGESNDAAKSARRVYAREPRELATEGAAITSLTEMNHAIDKYVQLQETPLLQIYSIKEILKYLAEFSAHHGGDSSSGGSSSGEAYLPTGHRLHGVRIKHNRFGSGTGWEFADDTEVNSIFSSLGDNGPNIMKVNLDTTSAANGWDLVSCFVSGSGRHYSQNIDFKLDHWNDTNFHIKGYYANQSGRLNYSSEEADLFVPHTSSTISQNDISWDNVAKELTIEHAISGGQDEFDAMASITMATPLVYAVAGLASEINESVFKFYDRATNTLLDSAAIAALGGFSFNVTINAPAEINFNTALLTAESNSPDGYIDIIVIVKPKASESEGEGEGGGGGGK
jgi:hypothetical protein